MRTIVRLSKNIKPKCSCINRKIIKLTNNVNQINKNVDKINKELDIMNSYNICNFLILNTSFFIWLIKG